jgi:hypothetical protein
MISHASAVFMTMRPLFRYAAAPRREQQVARNTADAACRSYDYNP